MITKERSVVWLRTNYYKLNGANTFYYQQDVCLNVYGSLAQPKCRIQVKINSYDDQSWVEAMEWTQNGWQRIFCYPAKTHLSLTHDVTNTNGKVENKLIYWNADLEKIVPACSDAVTGIVEELQEWYAKPDFSVA